MNQPSLMFDLKTERTRQLRRAAVLLVAIGIIIGLALDLGFRPGTLSALLPDMAGYASRYLRPDFSQGYKYAGLMWQTIGMALWGTGLALALAIVTAPLAAANFTPRRPLYHAVRLVQVFFRSMPDLLLALIFVSALGLGAMPGVLALALHTSGFLGKFLAENLERTQPGRLEALQATGAGYLQRLMYAGWPSILRETIGYTLYIFDRNVRMATVLGLVGAGGIGRHLNDSLRLFQYRQASAIIVIILTTIIAIDLLSNWLRKKYQ